MNPLITCELNLWSTPDEALIEAIESSDRRFDAIVVDEGQDFQPDWWVPLEMILNKDGYFYLFYDPSQNLYVGDDFTIPDLGKPYRLPTNCRNTKRIANTCSRVRGVEIPVRKDAPEGEEALVKVAKTAELQAKFCQQIVTDWIGCGGLKPSQIVIQCPHAKKNSSLKDLKSIKGVPITENLESWKNGKGILFSTIRSFKGLEADAVVIIDIAPPDRLPYFTMADFYVACSRAKHLLVLLPESDGIV